MDQLIGTHTNMGSSGRFVLRSMQDNNEMPLVDLFVREVLQNSLDAGTGKGNGFKDYVSVDFLIGKFNRERLNEELTGSTQLLNAAFPEDEYSFLAVKDCNTVGLNGKIEDCEYKEGEPLGNFKKLVYEIGEPQDNNGAGGSWGLGKTVYYRVGIGLILFYSQFRGDNGNLQSRLAAAVVEDKSDIKYLPEVSGRLRTGIAWWGQTAADGSNVPITDTAHITEILGYFGLSPFGEDETGSIIIIPYVDEDELNNKNRFEYGDADAAESPYWSTNLKDNLKMSVQRWYFPRIGNIDYKYGQYLKVSVCGEPITPHSFVPFFRILWEMYRFGSTGNGLNDDSFCTGNGIIPKTSTLELLRNNCFENDRKMGTLVYARIKNQRGIGLNLFDLSPYCYINTNPDGSSNRPIIPFVRKPGLIINYNANASWLNSKDLNLTEDEYLIGIFILNSDNRLQKKYAENLTLEEYVRKGEKAQHTEWIDQTLNSSQMRIVINIKNKIKDVLTEDYKAGKDKEPVYSHSGYAQRFSMILPPANFGRGPAFQDVSDNGGESRKRKTHKKKEKSELILDYDNLVYTKDGLEISGKLYLGKTPGKITIYLAIDSDGGETTLEEWLDEDRLEAPFEIDKVISTSETIFSSRYFMSEQKAFAYQFDAGDLTSQVLDITIFLKIFNRDYVPAIKMKESSGEDEE